MATYILLNIVFMLVVILVLRIKLRRPSRAWWITLLILSLMTVLFDSIMIYVGLFTYDTAKLLGLYVGNVPVEDFFYAVLAVVIIPVLWNRMENRK